MSSKEIFGFLTILPGPSKEPKPDDPVQLEVQAGNVFFKNVTKRRTIYFWDNNANGSLPQIMIQPWKMASLMTDDDDTVGHSFIGISSAAGGTAYPLAVPTPSIGTLDYKKFRATGLATTIASTLIPRVIGSVGAYDPLVVNRWMASTGNGAISINDVPLEYTQIGIVYPHPMVDLGLVAGTVAAANYITFTDAAYFDSPRMESHCHNIVRISTGADAGEYIVRFVDFINNRLYLMNLDGSLFVGQATAASVYCYAGHGRRAFFNEVGIIQLSQGAVVTGGTFRPGLARNSFILRVVFDKTGSDATETANEKQGSYYITMKPYTHGEGLYSNAVGTGGGDIGLVSENTMICDGGILPFGMSTNFDGGTNSMALDEPKQRLWFTFNGCLGYWRWKTAEGFREIAVTSGTAAHSTFVTPAIVLGTGDTTRDIRIGPAGVTYVSIHHATAGNGGIAIIKPDLTTLQYTIGSGAPSSMVIGTGLDATRARLGTAGDTTTNGSDLVTSTSGAFTTSDEGRVIKLTGLGADSGTYKIKSPVTPGTSVNVETLAGGVVTFTSQTGGRFEIGERLYLYFNNVSTGAGKINYMESMAHGTFLTRTVSMVNGAHTSAPAKSGGHSKVSVDPANGDIYWLSFDTAQQINKYNVATNVHSKLAIADVQTPSGGTGTIGTITTFTEILVNSKFDEIWVGTDQGQVKIVKSTFASGTVKRYFGADNGTYANPTGFLRPGGWRTTSSSTNVQSFWELPDGRVLVMLNDTSTSTIIAPMAYYSREADLWTFKEDLSQYQGGAGFYIGNLVFDSIGNYLFMLPHCRNWANGEMMLGFGCIEVQYQWDSANSRWIPKEVAQSFLPNKTTADNISPGCKSKPIHAGLEDVLYGVKIGFTKVGGLANNQFLGRAGQDRLTQTDGSTNGSTTFTGSGFTAGDVGKIIRIENSTTPADINVFRITAFLGSTTITVKNMNFTTFTPGTASGITYSIWDLGNPGTNAGPENATVLLADGFGKDNTQDITGIAYETYHFKTVLQENAEAIKFCVPNPLGVQGGLEMKVYYDFFPRVGTAILSSQDLATTQTRALPASEWTFGGFDGRKLVDGFVDGLMDGTANLGKLWSSPSDANVWYGTLASAGYGFLTPVGSALGNCPMVDLGADAEVGYVIIRGRTISTQSLTLTATNHGLKATLYKANGPTAPVASSVSRTSGSANLSLTINNNTITTTGDFLGPISLASLSNGAVTAGGNTFTNAAATFSQTHVGMILKITSFGDVGSYRITAVNVGGTIATVQKLDQTAQAWSATASSIVYEVRDGVREEDVICTNTVASPVQRLCIERLLTPTTAQVRIAPFATAASQSWQCAIPTWEKAKRVSHSTEAVAPDVKNNGTWVCSDGREQHDQQDFKIYMDLTDLTVAQRTGRWWQLQTMPRGANASSGDYYYSNFEFYSPTGARLGVHKSTFSDHSLNNADFLSHHVNRLDFIQSRYNAMTGVATFNGLADLGGASGDTLTLAGGNKFMGYQVRRPFTDGVCVAGLGGNLTSATAVFITSDVGRFVRIQTGANAGNYRIATRVSATAITLTLPSGAAAPSFTGTTGETFSIHEGISAGGVAPDRVVFLDDQTREYSVATINDALTTITIAESRQVAVTGKQWEIRRPAFDTASSSVDSTKLARLVRPANIYPLQTGDVAHDSRGALRFWADDIGLGNSRADGSVTGGNGVFVGSGFCSDDVGRLLYVTTGVTANKGVWEISVVTSATQITVVNAFTGAAVVFSADAAADKVYKIFGDRRFKLTKHVTTLRA